MHILYVVVQLKGVVNNTVGRYALKFPYNV